MPSLQVYPDVRSKLIDSLKRRADGIPRIMGIINATPDSFHISSRKNTLESALSTTKDMLLNGATWIDVGGESTRPGAVEVTAEEEIKRVIPIIEHIRKELPEALISIDTRKVEVAEKAIEAGAHMINDVSGFKNTEMVNLAVKHQVAVCIMHMQGNPQSMQDEPTYTDCRKEIYNELKQKAYSLVKKGLSKDLVVLDPGIGFGKKKNHNLELLENISELRGIGEDNSPKDGWKILWGISRKSLIGEITGKKNTEQRLAGTLATAAQAYILGVDILRVHDVDEHNDFLKVFSELRGGNK